MMMSGKWGCDSEIRGKKWVSGIPTEDKGRA